MNNETALSGIVRVRTQIPEEAMTAQILGSEREGHGIRVSEDGLVVTIGYVITEATSVWIIDCEDQAVEGFVVAYDQRSGFGLVQALKSLNGEVLQLADSARVTVGQQMYLAGAGGNQSMLPVTVVEVREFAGYWEYMIDNAIFTEPAHPDWGGTALLDEQGKVYGIGSLVLQSDDSSESARNMVIPINLYSEISEELIGQGGRNQPARPWMGWYVQNSGQGPVVIGVVDDAPSQRAGIQPGDLIAAINGRRVGSINELYKCIWGSGVAGVTVDVAIKRDAELKVVSIESIDRSSLLWRSALH